MASEAEADLAEGTRKRVRIPIQKRYCKREAAPKRSESCVD